jgi:hypothetical protein
MMKERVTFSCHGLYFPWQLSNLFLTLLKDDAISLLNIIPIDLKVEKSTTIC